MRSRVAACLSTAALALAAAAPAHAAARDFPVGGFDRVQLDGVGTVTVRTGGGFAMHAEGDPEAVSLLRATVENGRLVIGWNRDHVSFHHGVHLQILVTLPRLAGVDLAGAGTIEVPRVDAPDFSAAIGGAGDIHLADLAARHAVLTVSGTGTLTAAGHVDQLDERVSGVGSIDAQALAARGGRVTVSGTGHIRTRIDGPADVTLSGLGGVDVSGHAACSVHKSGLGSVRCG